MPDAKFSPAIEGASHATFAGVLYAIGELLAEHHTSALAFGLPAAGLIVVIIFRRPVARRVKLIIRKNHKPVAYRLAQNSETLHPAND